MNIFYLDSNPRLCVRYHCDKHVVKMCLEYAQLLSTAHAVLDDREIGYKPTHKNHPCAVWVRESNGNYIWLWSLLQSTYAEFTKRYSKVHKGQREGLLGILSNYPRNIPRYSVLEDKFQTPVPLCMPDKYKSDCAVESYRAYYMGEKREIATWKTDKPEWWIDE